MYTNLIFVKKIIGRFLNHIFMEVTETNVLVRLLPALTNISLGLEEFEGKIEKLGMREEEQNKDNSWINTVLDQLVQLKEEIQQVRRRYSRSGDTAGQEIRQVRRYGRSGDTAGQELQQVRSYSRSGDTAGQEVGQ